MASASVMSAFYRTRAFLASDHVTLLGLMEAFQNIQEEAGTSQNVLSPFDTKEWLTVDEAVVHFRELGLPRSAEAIRGYCRAGKIEATTTQGVKGEQHVLKRESANSFITERKIVIAAMTRDIPEDAGISRKIPVVSVSSRQVPEDAGTARDDGTLKEKDEEITKLKDEIMSLKIDKAARDQLVTILRDERAQLADTAMEQSRKVGELETRLQLSPPPAARMDIPKPDEQGEQNVMARWGIIKR